MMKLPRIILGVILALGGLALYVAGAYTIVRAYEADTALDAQAEKIEQQCRKQLTSFKKIRSRPDRTIVVDLGEVTDPRSTLSDFTAIVAMCPFQPVVDACIGTDCGQKASKTPTATMTLGTPLR